MLLVIATTSTLATDLGNLNRQLSFSMKSWYGGAPLDDALELGVGRPSALSSEPAIAIAQRVRHAAVCWAEGAWVNDTPRAARTKLAFLPPTNLTEPWFWEPVDTPACPPFLHFDRRDFCRLLQGRPVHVIGDSMSGLFQDYLMMSASDGTKGGRPAHASDDSTIICEDVAPARVPMLRIYRVTANKSTGLAYKGDGVISGYCGGTPSTPCKGSRIVVLNRGLHGVNTLDLLQEIRGLIEVIRQETSRVMIIWRDTPVGHPDCMSYTAPIASPINASIYAASGEAFNYDWMGIYKQNANVSAMLQKEFPDVVWMEVSLATMLRPDKHARVGELVAFSCDRAPVIYHR